MRPVCAGAAISDFEKGCFDMCPPVRQVNRGLAHIDEAAKEAGHMETAW